MTSSRRRFVGQLALGSFAAWQLPAFANAQTSVLPRSTPEEQGVASAHILAFIDGMKDAKHELHSFMMLRHGKVIAEGWAAPYGPQLNHTMYSLSKSFTSTAVGFAVAEGKLSVEDKVISFFPEDVPEVISENLAALRIKDLLTMSVGSEHEPTQGVVRSENWVRTFLAHSIKHKPGTVFLYNSVATYMCSAIVQKVTGQKIIDYLKPRLFDPLGITGMTWEQCPMGINTGGWGLGIQTEGIAKFAQLLLQKGEWQGKRILPADWIEEATSKHIQQAQSDRPDRPTQKNDWQQGYGYQFWRSQHGAFRGDGASGQFAIVLPEQDAVIAITEETSNMQGVLDLVWQHLLPACEKAALAPDPAALTKLQTRLANLALTPPAGEPTSPTAQRVTGQTYQFERNALGVTQARFDFDDKGVVMTATVGNTPHVIRHTFGSWTLGECRFPGTPPRLISGGAPKQQPTSRIATSVRWKDADAIEFTWRYIETPHRDTITCRFGPEKVKITFSSSLARLRGRKDGRRQLVGSLPGTEAKDAAQ